MQTNNHRTDASSDGLGSATHELEDGSPESDTVAGDEVPAVPPTFAVQDAGTANWVVRKILEARAYAKRIESWAAAEVRRAEHEERFFLERFGGQLERWAADEIQRLNGRKKSLNLPAGIVGFRTPAPKLVINEMNALLDWCRRCLPDAIQLSIEVAGDDAVRLRPWLAASGLDVQTHEQVAKHLVNRHAQETGEIPPGTAWVDGETTFYLK